MIGIGYIGRQDRFRIIIYLKFSPKDFLHFIIQQKQQTSVRLARQYAPMRLLQVIMDTFLLFSRSPKSPTQHKNIKQSCLATIFCRIKGMSFVRLSELFIKLKTKVCLEFFQRQVFIFITSIFFLHIKTHPAITAIAN